MGTNRRFRFLGPSVMACLLALLTGLALACGSAAPAAPQPGVNETVREVEKVVEVERVVEKTVETEVEKLVVVTPTPVPEDPNAIVRREKLTILTSSFGNEVYNSRYLTGDKGIWWYPLQERMINANEKLELTDKGIINKWELTDDNLGWEYTLRDDATFHNGDPVTAEDIAFTFQWSFHKDSISRVRQRIVNIID